MPIALALIGVVFVAYGAAVMSVWSGTWFFAVWYGLGAVLLVLAWCVHTGAWAQMPVVARRIIEVVACVFVVGVLVFGGMATSGFGQQGEDDLDYIVVLGAQVREDGPSKVLKYRLDTACDYLARNPRTQCIVSGGQGFNEPRAEADVMAEYLESRGVDPSRIIREAASLNTAENISNSKALIGDGNARIGIVTNDFHVFRGTGIARKHGMDNICGIAAPSDALFLPNNLLREAMSIAKDYATGNL